MNRQLDIFSLMSEKYKINTDKVLLIELFAQLLDIDNVEITKKYIKEIKR